MQSDILSSKKSSLDLRSPPTSPLFLCVISYTATCEVPGITAAGANPSLLKYTSVADAEYLHYGHCKCIDAPPATPDGKPTPAVITRAALNLGNIPLIVVNAGAKIRPSIPFLDMGLDPGRNIAYERAMDPSNVLQAVEYGKMLGRQLSQVSDLLVIGESIPGGTTTALAVLCALGIDAKFHVSSSMVKNPHELKNKIVDSALQREKKKVATALDAVSAFGDPMMASVAGLATGAIEGKCNVLLAGGTQMVAVLAVLKEICDYGDKVRIGTTKYVLRDKTSAIEKLVKAVDPDVPVLACDLHLEDSSEPGLRAFADGFVKEGVGAGGASIVSTLMMTLNSDKSSKEIDKERNPKKNNDKKPLLLQAIEKEYREHIIRNPREKKG